MSLGAQYLMIQRFTTVSYPSLFVSMYLFASNYTTKIHYLQRQVRKAIEFARKAHQGQVRRTGDPYLTHCLHTGKFLALLVPSTGKRVGIILASTVHECLASYSMLSDRHCI